MHYLWAHTRETSYKDKLNSIHHSLFTWTYTTKEAAQKYASSLINFIWNSCWATKQSCFSNPFILHVQYLHCFPYSQWENEGNQSQRPSIATSKPPHVLMPTIHLEWLALPSLAKIHTVLCTCWSHSQECSKSFPFFPLPVSLVYLLPLCFQGYFKRHVTCLSLLPLSLRQNLTL